MSDFKMVDGDEKEIAVGATVIYGAPNTPEEIEAQTGTVVRITDSDFDFDDDLGRAREYPPLVVVKFADGSEEDVYSHNVTSAGDWHAGMGPTYQADDLMLVVSE